MEKTINEKLKNSSLDLRELFYSMEPVSADELTSDHPLFSLIITEMKNTFFTGTQPVDLAYRTRDQKAWMGESGFGTAGWMTTEFAPDLATIKSTIDTPGSWAYKRFWGNPGMGGPWPQRMKDDLIGTDVDIDKSGDMIYEELFLAGIGFMERASSPDAYKLPNSWRRLWRGKRPKV